MEKVYQFDFTFDTQKVFRELLDAMAKPMTVHDVGQESEKFGKEDGALLAAGCTVLDNETGFYVEKNVRLRDELVDLTLARVTAPCEADYIFLSAPLNYESIRVLFEGAKKGTLSDPQLSATFFIVCDSLTGDIRARVNGPGIDGTKILHLPEYIYRICTMHGNYAAEYPCGTDLIFVTQEGELMAFPRLCRISREG